MASVCPDELSLSPVTSWLSVSGDERKSGPAFSVTHGGCGCVGNDRLPPPPPPATFCCAPAVLFASSNHLLAQATSPYKTEALETKLSS